MDARRVAHVAAVALALGASLVLLVLPVYAVASESSDGSSRSGTQTLLEAGGLQVIWILAIPVVLAAAPLFVKGRGRRPVAIVSATLLTAFVLVSGFTIGLFYAPASLAAIVAAALPQRLREGDRAGGARRFAARSRIR